MYDTTFAWVVTLAQKSFYMVVFYAYTTYVIRCLKSKNKQFKMLK